MRLSKSKVMLGLQCHRRLWWTIHDRDAPELVTPPELQAFFDRGSQVGALACEAFPPGKLVDLAQLGSTGAIEHTRALLAAGTAVVFEASFAAHDVFVAVDVLSHERDGWVVSEVKSTLSVKEQHLRDAAIQAWVVRGAGLAVPRIEVVHLNREHRHPNHGTLFLRSDVTPAVEAIIATLPRELDAQTTMLERSVPSVEPGPQCERPYTCPFMKRCWPRVPRHHVSELYGIDAARVARLQAQGYAQIRDIPEDVELRGAQDRQRRAVSSGRVIVENTLLSQLASVVEPVAYLDFETISPPVPVWDGSAPYGTVPVQFSVHRRAPDGVLEHRVWLAERGADPREALAKALLRATEGTGSVIAYNAPFEAACIRALADAVPELAADLEALAGRLFDLLPVVRSCVYHPDFRGSFSLKSVLPALVPEMGYGDLEIADGLTASVALEMMLIGPAMDVVEYGRVRAGLSAYCARDTEALVALHARLRELAEGQGAG